MIFEQAFLAWIATGMKKNEMTPIERECDFIIWRKIGNTRLK